MSRDRSIFLGRSTNVEEAHVLHDIYDHIVTALTASMPIRGKRRRSVQSPRRWAYRYLPRPPMAGCGRRLREP
jgi:hypothetical protein